MRHFTPMSIQKRRYGDRLQVENRSTLRDLAGAIPETSIEGGGPALFVVK
jgi:hypothetical protein